MKANEDKHLEKLAARLMNETSLEKPSVEFTSKVMFQALASDTSPVTKYKPLISKPFWFIIFGAVITLMGYLIISAGTQAGSWFDRFDRVINDKLLNSFSGYKFSETTLFAVALLTVLLFVQISFLKNYFNKRVKS